MFIKLFVITKTIILKNTLKGLTRPCLSDFTYTKVSGVASQYILWSVSLCYPLRSRMLKKKPIFSLVISKVILDFSAVQLDEAKNYINKYVRKNNSRSLRGVRTRIRHIQNQNHILNPSIFATPVHSEPRYI